MAKILIIEDLEMNRDLLEQLLEDDHELSMAENGIIGLEMAQENPPDLVLMDLSMPGMDGWETTRRFKAIGEFCHIPVIAITSNAMPGDEEDARNAGCDDYMTTPIDEDLLFEKINIFLTK